jgi:hypothetical protein
MGCATLNFFLASRKVHFCAVKMIGGAKGTDKMKVAQRQTNQARADDIGRFAPIGGAPMAANEFCC